MRPSSGFTLVELVTVMMVMGILAIGTVQFITDTSEGYAATMARSELAADARFAIDRVSRELREALPGSVRVSGGCVEYLPVLGASTYITLPVALAAGSFRSVPLDPLPVPAGARAAVYPDPGVYGLGSPAAISPPVTVAAPDASNEVIVTMASPHRFPVESPSNRYFLVADPVSYCVDGGSLWRYSGYGYLSAQPGVALLPAALPGRALVAQYVSSAAPFTFNAPTLTRNAVIEVNVRFSRGDDAITVEHLTQIRNVP